jgi:hypothetical protein
MAEAAGDGGHLGADEARADHHHPLRRPRRQPLAQPAGVTHVAQVDDALEVAAGSGQSARAGAGGDQEGRVAQVFAILELDRFCLRVDPNGPPAEQELDAVVGVVVGWAQVDLLLGQLPGGKRL